MPLLPIELSSTAAGLQVLSQGASAQKPLQEIFLGTSHVAGAINPSILTSDSVVIATSFLDLRGMAIFIRTNLDTIMKSKRIFIEVGGEILVLNKNRSTIQGDTLTQESLDALLTPNIDDLYLADLGVVPSLSVKDWTSHFQKAFKIAFPSLFANKFDPEMILDYQKIKAHNIRKLALRGHDPSNRMYNSSDPDNSALVIAAKRVGMTSPKNFKFNMAIINSIIDHLSSLKIKLVLIRYPKQLIFTDLQPPEWETLYQDFADKISSARQGQDEVRVLDLTKYGPWEDTLFRDADHLNSDGAKRVALLLNQWTRETFRH